MRKQGVGKAVFLATLLVAPLANAHISLEKGGTHLSRYGDDELKAGPCGRANGLPGTHLYTYAPGATIEVKLVEFIPHPGYFRFAFDPDGDDGFKEPASIKPVDPKRKCPTGPGDHCGESDFYNSPEVLPGMDNLNPHLAGGTKTYSWQVTLPDVECDHCTLQVIQVMEDDGPHGPYDPTPGVGVADIYHQCIDIRLTREAAGDGGASDGGAGPSEPAGDAKGCNVARGPAGASFAGFLGLVLASLGARRRRR
jgi:hypothetical protein